MKTAQRIENHFNSQTIVTDTVKSKSGLILLGTVASMGILAGFGVDATWAFKVPFFIGGAWVLIDTMFGEPDEKWKGNASKTKTQKVVSSEAREGYTKAQMAYLAKQDKKGIKVPLDGVGSIVDMPRNGGVWIRTELGSNRVG